MTQEKKSRKGQRESVQPLGGLEGQQPTELSGEVTMTTLRFRRFVEVFIIGKRLVLKKLAKFDKNE